LKELDIAYSLQCFFYCVWKKTPGVRAFPKSNARGQGQKHEPAPTPGTIEEMLVMTQLWINLD